jgi:cell division septum initiation protein DivIVA
MDVTTELLDTFEFNKKGRGYDPKQVDELIAGVRSTLGDLETRLADATSRAEAAEARASDAEARSRTSSESDDTIQRTLLLAQRTADAAVQEAEETAAKKVGDAEVEARRLVEEADGARARALANAEEEVRRSVEDSRTRLAQEIGSLEHIRNTLMADVEGIEEHIELERSRLRASSDALTDILSRSDRLGQVELPELSDVDPTVVASEVSSDSELSVETADSLEPEADVVTAGEEDAAAAAATWSAVEDVDRSSGDAGDPVEAPAPAGEVSSVPVPTERATVPVEGTDTIDAPPPPPPPPPVFDDDDVVDAIDEPPPPPPPPPAAIDEPAPATADDATTAAPAPEEPAGGFGGLGDVTGDLDPDNAEDNAWLAELADDDTETAGTGDSGRRRFGRRR